jgi:hypothetical protein
MERKRLTEVLNATVLDQWEQTDAAPEMSPLPKGEYTAAVESGALFNAKSGTAGYKLAFLVTEPAEYKGRKLWHDVWLTPAALPMAKRDLAKLGVTQPDQLERPIPEGIIVRLRVALRTGDDGREFNVVTRFDVVSIDPPDEPFSPQSAPLPPKPPADSQPAAAADPDGDRHGDGYEPEADRLNPQATQFDVTEFADPAVSGPYGAGGDRR